MAATKTKKTAAKKPSAKARSAAAKKAAATRKAKAQESAPDVITGVELPVRTTGSVELSRRPQDTLENRVAEG